MEVNFNNQKISLLKNRVKELDPKPIKYELAVAGVQILFFIHGETKEEVLKFFQYYFKDFPSINIPAHITIHYFTFAQLSPYSNPGHPFWNEPTDQFHITLTESEKLISQRDFVAFQDLKSNDFFATGPTLDQGCCDSTDNLIQYALGKHLIINKILPLHAATVIVENKAYVFFGESGAGKSTLATQSYALNQFKIMSGDQIFLKQTESGLRAFANTTTIFGFHRDHPAWEPKNYPVQSVIHLLKSPRKFHYKNLTYRALMPLILRETVSWKEVLEPRSLLDLVVKIGENKDIKWGEMSYQKDESFWPKLLGELN